MKVPDTQEELQEWYSAFEPKGSGPLQMLRIIRALILALAKERGYDIKQ